MLVYWRKIVQFYKMLDCYDAFYIMILGGNFSIEIYKIINKWNLHCWKMKNIWKLFQENWPWKEYQMIRWLVYWAKCIIQSLYPICCFYLMTSGNCLFLGSDKMHVALGLNQ